MKYFVNINLLLILTTGLSAQTDEQAANQFIKSSFHLSEVMLHDVANPPAAARFYAYAMLSAYEVLQRNQPTMLALSKNFQVVPDFVELSLPTKFNPAFCATYAMLETGRLMLPSGYMLEEKQRELVKVFQKHYNLNIKNLEANRQYANLVAAQVVAYAKKDGYFSLSILPRYKPNTKDAGRWYPTPPEYMGAIEPQWKTIRTFFLDSANQFVPDAPAPFSIEKGSSFLNQLEEVVTVSKNLTAEQKAIAAFWDCNPFAVTYSGHAAIGMKKISPGGHWMGITGIACRKANASFQKTIAAHAFVALSLHDAFVSCWHEKYRSDRIRPESAINKYVDEAWRPLLQTPPFPEYTSGHSVISTASAEVLSHLFGENFEYLDTSEEYFGLPARSFKSFKAAAQEAAISRLYGGIHFRDAIEAGQRQGEAIGKYIVNKINNQPAPQWLEVYPGVWKNVVGIPEKINLLDAAAIQPAREALAKLPKAAFPLEKTEISTQVIGGKTYLRFPLDEGEQVFGLGLNFQSVNQRGRIMTLHVDHYGGQDNGRTHAPVPFYVSSKGYGVLVDAARYITVYAGTAIRVDAKHPPVLQDRNTDKDWNPQPYSDAVEMLVPAEGATLYIFGGPTPMYAVQRYNLMNGGGYLPPKWGLGFTQRVPTLYSQEDILKEVQQFEEHQFPLTFIGVEPGWHSMSYPCTFEWDKTRFPNPKDFLQKLADKGISANLWLNPYVSPKASLFPKIKPFTGSHTVWNGIVPDFTMPQARQLFKEHFMRHHLDIGVGGYKIDEVDGFDNWVWPDVATFPSGTDAEQMRQTYGLMVQQMTAGWFKEINKRTYGLVRASNAGASNLPYVIYNDYYSHRDFITALVNSSFIGVLWTPEVRASKSPEEWVRRMQSVCFSPMAMINAWADGTKPWTFPEVEKAVSDVANLRMELLPYLYSTFAQYRFEGKPPFRAMNLVEGFGFKSEPVAGTLNTTDNPYAMSLKKDINDQYMMGDYLLVAPMFAGEKSRKVYLPQGKWYDFYTGKEMGENQVITITPSLDKIPLFVKDGGIIPMIPPRNQTPKAEIALPLIVRHYGTAAGSFQLYDDDGTSFDYEKGQCSFTPLSVLKGVDGKLQGTMTVPAPGKPFGYDKKVTWVFMTRGN